MQILLGHIVEGYLPSADALAAFADTPGDIPLLTSASTVVTASMVRLLSSLDCRIPPPA
jgi:hypothetical protein